MPAHFFWVKQKSWSLPQPPKSSYICNRRFEPFWNALHQNTDPTNFEPRLCHEDLNEYIWRKFRRLILFGSEAVVHVEVCCEISGGIFKEEHKSKHFADLSPQTSPHTLTPHSSLRNFAGHFTGKTSPAIWIWQQNMLYLWVLTRTCMFIGVNLATLEQK